MASPEIQTHIQNPNQPDHLSGIEQYDPDQVSGVDDGHSLSPVGAVTPLVTNSKCSNFLA